MRIINRQREHAVGYGAIALYCGVIGAIAIFAGGVYGFDNLPLVGKSADKTEVRPAKGKMLITAADRVHCTEYSIDNETQQILSGGVTYCDENWKKLKATSPSVNGIRDAFGKR